MATKHTIFQEHLQIWLNAQGNKKKRGEISKTICSITGAHPKSVARTFLRLQMRDSTQEEKRGRGAYYTSDVRAALKDIWIASDECCGENLHPMIGEYIDILIRDKLWSHRDIATSKLRAMSARTTRRMTERFEKSRGKGKGKSATKPSNLKSLIPIFKGPWKELPPGYRQIDTVAHCGDTLRGDFTYTLTAIDSALYWINLRAQWNKGQVATITSLEHVEEKSPVPIIEYHPDTGSEFINHQAKAHCDILGIKMTRSEPSHKNDNMFVEERNGHVVRRYLAYQRLDCLDVVAVVNSLYDHLEDFLNHFKPVRRQLSRTRVGAKYVRTFEKVASTPYQRLLEHPDVAQEVKEHMKEKHKTLNPLLLKREIDTIVTQIYQQQSRHKTGLCVHSGR